MLERIHTSDILRRKRDGHALTTAEIQHIIDGVVDQARLNSPTDAQLGAFLMAVFQKGLNARELADLTTAMRFSGDTFDAAPLHTFMVDKHSTGGVGDKTSLLIAPIVAAAGLRGKLSISVPMISGRSLGHTGGTLDKLETIPGFNTQLSLSEFTKVLKQCHAALIGQTPSLVPADRILYALRDHTSTVESPFLICASIMSKKLAESLNGLVLDVKTGSGAFLPGYEQAKLLSELMVQTGETAGTRTVALITSMDQPLGRFAGNWMEVWECVDIMRGERHSRSADLIELSNILAGWMLHLAGAVATPEDGAILSDELLQDGSAYQAWLGIVEAQDGDVSAFNEPASRHTPGASRTLAATRSGFLVSMNCTDVGWAVQRLGAGRLRPGDPVSAHAGIEMHVKLGDAIEVGQPLVTLYAEDDTSLDESFRMLGETLQIGDRQPTLQPLVREIITCESPDNVGRLNTKPD
jgi:pyrimidine-nucleoside phosphorylase